MQMRVCVAGQGGGRRCDRWSAIRAIRFKVKIIAGFLITVIFSTVVFLLRLA